MTTSGGTFSLAGDLDFPCLICQGLDTNFGSPRDLTFDCAGNLYVTSASQVLKYRNAGALPPPCGKKRRHLELALSPVVRLPKGKPGKMSLTLGCTGDECSGVVKVTTDKPGCARCRLVVAKQRFHIMGGSPEPLELTVRRAALPVIGQVPLSLRLAAKAHAAHAGHRSIVVPEATALASADIGLVCPTGGSASVTAAATGTLDPAQATSIAAQIEAPGGTTTAVTVDADTGGHFSVPVTPDRAGDWTIRAGFAGDAAVDPASASCTFTVADVLPAVQVVCPAAGVVGTAFEATGSIDPVRTDGQGGIEFAAPSGGLTVIPGGDASGMLNGSLVPHEAGTWSVRGRWTSVAGAVAASSPCTVPVQPLASSLTLTCPTGAPLTFTGTLTPGFAGASIHISYAPAGGGPPLERTVMTAADGSFSDTLPVGTVNSGTAQASFAGDAGHGPASSSSCGF
jgi:hypothetical protein